MIVFFCFFFFSGFCSLLYQVVWLRMAMADFGVTTAQVSIVLSVFMAGLATGSWGGGKLVQRFASRSGTFFVRLYGLSELLIGVSGLAVAPLLRVGHGLLIAHDGHAAWGSFGYYLLSGGWIALVMLPFCFCMGATFPLAMAGIKFQRASPWTFSYLYLANVLGAMAGATSSAFVLIELLGFSKTLLAAVGVNALVALSAFALGQRREDIGTRLMVVEEKGAPSSEIAMLLPLLFTSGLASLGMEVVWTRQLVPLLGPVVYSFAIILAVYLFATAVGSQVYRVWIRFRGARAEVAWRPLVILAGGFALLPLAAADPRIRMGHHLLSLFMRVAWGIGWFCAVLGFLTPMLVDRWSGGDAGRAGRAYAVNALGCIAGPLLSGFLLLPAAGERWSLVLLALPFLAFGLWPSAQRKTVIAASTMTSRAGSTVLVVATVAASMLLIAKTRDYETFYPGAWVRRDHTATVIAAGQGMQKRLLVNGTGITNLTPITKMMAHLPLSYLRTRPRNVLVLCFGMGTSFRSAMSWGVPVTVVELVPSVPSLFGYFHADGDALLRSPRATVVIDDARRYLERVGEDFDVIIVDPPPPVEAAESSLLYSPQFYEVARRRLRPGGILQQWLPGGAEPFVLSAFAQAIGKSFPDVRVFPSVEGWGFHFLASVVTMGQRTPGQLTASLPAGAARDLLEWGPFQTADEQFQAVVDKEVPLGKLIGAVPGAPALTDDRPVNEYYFLRRR
jgi:spermidine synthase